MIVDHFDQQVIEDADLILIALLVAFRSENIWPDSDRHVVRVHLVHWLVVNNFLEKLNVELEGVEVERRELIEQVFDVEEHDLL